MPIIAAAVAVLLLALTMRIPTISLGPLLPAIQSDTGHGETFVSLLTTIPLALTLLVAPITPRLAALVGRSRLLAAALGTVVLGTALRSVPGDAWLLAGTACLGVAIAVGTVLAPAAIAAEPSHRRSALTSVYSAGLSLGPALALGLTIPMMHATSTGWRGALMLWAPCAAAALVMWVLYTRIFRPDSAGARAVAANSDSVPSSTVDSGPADSRSPESTVRTVTVAADPRVWLLAVYLGVTSLSFYTVSTWLPTTLVLDGMPPDAAGGLASVVNLVAIPFALLAPLGMRRGLAPVLAPLSPALAAAGAGALLTTGASGALVVSMLLGVSQGLCLGIAYAQIVRFATSPGHAGAVSAVTSAAGIALAALGPLAFGSGLEATGRWTVPVTGLGIVLLVHTVVGVRTGRLARSPRG